MVLGMLFDNFKNYFIVRYNIYDFLKIVSEVPQPTCLVRTFCAWFHTWFLSQPKPVKAW